MQSPIVSLFVCVVTVSAAASGVQVTVHSPSASACAILTSPVRFTATATMLEPSQATSWNQVLGVQYQQDIGPSATGFRQWIDAVNLTVW